MSATNPDLDLLPAQVLPADRAAADAAFFGDTGIVPPLPEVSEMWVLRGAGGEVLGAAYVGMRHSVEAYVSAPDAPADTLARLLAAIGDSLRSYVRETLVALGGDSGGSASGPPMPADVTPTPELSYDVYVPEGGSCPASGFERLPVEVWRRRVC